MPIITLTTDFGTQDGYVGAMKGRILTICPSATIVDITHDISAQDLLQAAFCIRRSIPEFPADTIHVIVVDPGVGSARAGIVVKTPNGVLVAPDNGVISFLSEVSGPFEIYKIYTETANWKAHSSFDGLAVFSPVGACIANGMPVEEVGVPVNHYETLNIPLPTVEKKQIIGEIILFDRFGNAVTNISADQLESFSSQSLIVQCEDKELPLCSHYQEGNDNTDNALAIINSDQLLELSIFCGSIQTKYQFKKGVKVRVFKR